MEVATCAARSRSRAGASLVATTTTVFAAAPASVSSTNSRTSLPRSPTSATTTTSAGGAARARRARCSCRPRNREQPEPLTEAERQQAVERSDPGRQRVRDGALRVRAPAGSDWSSARGLAGDGTRLAVDRSAEPVEDPAEQRFAHAHFERGPVRLDEVVRPHACRVPVRHGHDAALLKRDDFREERLPPAAHDDRVADPRAGERRREAKAPSRRARDRSHAPTASPRAPRGVGPGPRADRNTGPPSPLWSAYSVAKLAPTPIEVRRFASVRFSSR